MKLIFITFFHFITFYLIKIYKFLVHYDTSFFLLFDFILKRDDFIPDDFLLFFEAFDFGLFLIFFVDLIISHYVDIFSLFFVFQVGFIKITHPLNSPEQLFLTMFDSFCRVQERSWILRKLFSFEVKWELFVDIGLFFCWVIFVKLWNLGDSSLERLKLLQELFSLHFNVGVLLFGLFNKISFESI